MTKRKVLLATALCTGLIAGGALFAQRPVENIDPHRHPNLAEAQQHLIQAFNKTDEAQRDNKEELGGHAEKAKDLMIQADHELKAAAEYAEHRR